MNHWYNLSDVETEELVKEFLNFVHFYGFLFEVHIQNHTNLCIFSNEIIAKKEYECLLKKISKELKSH
ncbi:MAG: hypothetical protein ACMUEL_06410 [Flavobacteriales bacterium Tduv]